MPLSRSVTSPAPSRGVPCQSRKSPVVSRRTATRLPRQTRHRYLFPAPPRECSTASITLLIVLHSKLWFT
ncbi:hypothetical protein PI124_g19402 [Phytophthora idaei]|nr:hypothetical protein PI125_g22886 [Phytophthora idaei]KAG3129316.1 hypothetical protein PI126_g21028 [Phytophthora idaei]KAG3235569.1 hypothetical protein PI124_g19402 [Phytophthora idaei]